MAGGSRSPPRPPTPSSYGRLHPSQHGRWVEVATFFHLFLGCWSYANVPSDPYGSDTWTPPFVNGTKAESSFLARVTGANATGGAVGGFSDGYNISGHVNSYGARRT